VVTLALAAAIDEIAARDLLPKDWQKKFPNSSTLYTSTITGFRNSILITAGSMTRLLQPIMQNNLVSLLNNGLDSSGCCYFNYLTHSLSLFFTLNSFLIIFYA
jgi:ABC-type sulfate transport system substrate-binding protein